ncbi:hypothetical protein FQR65_LT15424 [Abscondita terminalis]|nr:hypothetical protein FQR65_LT15424 [Abscondita terminalis]
MHDIAKPATKRFDKKLGWTFHGHEDKGARMVPKLFAELKLPLHDKMKFVAETGAFAFASYCFGQRYCYRFCDVTTKNEYKKKKYRENFELVKQKLKDVEERDQIRNWQPPITGEDIMRVFNLGPGREVGKIKNAIREAILEGDITIRKSRPIILCRAQNKWFGSLSISYIIQIKDFIQLQQWPYTDFRVTFEDYEDVYREIDMFQAEVLITDAYTKLQITKQRFRLHFYVSNDQWKKGTRNRPSSFRKKDQCRRIVDGEYRLSKFIDDPHQKFYYIYNFDRPYDFHVELIKILKEEDGKEYPVVFKTVGAAPKHLGLLLQLESVG